MQYKKTNKVKRKQERFDLDGDNYLFVLEMSAKDLVELQARYQDDKEHTAYDFTSDLLARCLTDQDGNCLFENLKDLQANFPVGMSTIWALRDKVMSLSSLPEKKV